MFGYRRDNWKEFRERVTELKAQGIDDAAARKQAGAERAAKKEARAKELALLKAERDAKALTCQICARPILANTGTIAHHGYERPGDGFQTASCWGARKAPFEESCVDLVKEIAGSKERVANMIKGRAKIAAEEIAIHVMKESENLQERGKMKSFIINRQNFDELREANKDFFRYYSMPSFDNLKERELANRDHSIKSTQYYINWQEGRLAKWKQTLHWIEPKGKQLGRWAKV
jgi:hypothetical protein